MNDELRTRIASCLVAAAILVFIFLIMQTSEQTTGEQIDIGTPVAISSYVNEYKLTWADDNGTMHIIMLDYGQVDFKITDGNWTATKVETVGYNELGWKLDTYYEWTISADAVFFMDVR